MTSFQHILFPVDFSEGCRRAAPFVKAFVNRFHSELTILHVFELPLPLTGMTDSPWSVLVESDEARAVRRAELESFLADRSVGLKVQREVSEGDAALQIDCYVKEWKVDLIMMPTHGYGRFRRFFARFGYRQSSARRELPRMDQRSHPRAHITISGSVPANSVRRGYESERYRSNPVGGGVWQGARHRRSPCPCHPRRSSGRSRQRGFLWFPDRICERRACENAE